MTSKWAEGIKPRGFRWIITDRLGVCERPGGYGLGHRRVRRVEEIVWLCCNEIDLIVTMTAIPYNLHDYDEHGLAYVHLPFSDPASGVERYQQILETIRTRTATERVVLHHEAIGDPSPAWWPDTCFGPGWSTRARRPSPSPSGCWSASSVPRLARW